MAKQTFIIRHWYGAETYIGAARREADEGHNPKEHGHDFDRVAYKKKETALAHLRDWRRRALRLGLGGTFATLTRDDARYEIIATPDGYNGNEVVASGWMKDLDE